LRPLIFPPFREVANFPRRSDWSLSPSKGGSNIIIFWSSHHCPSSSVLADSSLRNFLSFNSLHLFNFLFLFSIFIMLIKLYFHIMMTQFVIFNYAPYNSINIVSACFIVSLSLFSIFIMLIKLYLHIMMTQFVIFNYAPYNSINIISACFIMSLLLFISC